MQIVRTDLELFDKVIHMLKELEYNVPNSFRDAQNYLIITNYEDILITSRFNDELYTITDKEFIEQSKNKKIINTVLLKKLFKNIKLNTILTVTLTRNLGNIDDNKYYQIVNSEGNDILDITREQYDELLEPSFKSGDKVYVSIKSQDSCIIDKDTRTYISTIYNKDSTLTHICLDKDGFPHLYRYISKSDEMGQLVVLGPNQVHTFEDVEIECDIEEFIEGQGINVNNCSYQIYPYNK